MRYADSRSSTFVQINPHWEITMAARGKDTTKTGPGKNKKSPDADTLTQAGKGAEIELTEEELRKVTGAAAKKGFV
jgi:hypothetical protein